MLLSGAGHTVLRAGLDFVFHMFFLVRYCKSLEEGSFRGRSADFLWMLVLGGTLMTCCAPFVVTVRFLGPSLSFMLVYVWARRNPYTNLSFLGIFNFTAPFLPWVLMALSVMLGGSPVVDLLGMLAGHMYYYFEDVYPRISGRRPLKTPGVIKALFPDEAIRHHQPQEQQQQINQQQWQQQWQEQQQPGPQGGDDN